LSGPIGIKIEYVWNFHAVDAEFASTAHSAFGEIDVPGVPRPDERLDPVATDVVSAHEIVDHAVLEKERAGCTLDLLPQPPPGSVWRSRSSAWRPSNRVAGC
jgi:hypothetical protein